mgnify:CR=1 FL=1
MTAALTQPDWAISNYLEVKNNHLHINGVDAITLAEEFDTPLFVISAPRIRHNIAQLLEAQKHHPKLKLCFASKANNLLAVLRTVREAGIDVEVNSGGELFRALRAGFRPDQIEMNGISKSEQEIAEAKSGILQSNQLRRAQDGALSGTLAAYQRIGRDMSFVANFEERLKALTPQQVLDTMRKYIDPAKLTLAYAGDFAKAEAKKSAAVPADVAKPGETK